MKTCDLVHEIVKVAEKAAHLARSVRAEKALFELLVEEKKGEEKNKRFIQDFKTLADVLVQEMVQHHLKNKFPSLADHIHGEESNKFTNVLGETVTVEIKSSAQETADLLSLVLDGDSEAAMLLAKVVHEDVDVEENWSDLGSSEIVDGSIGIWIDPIDSTAQYIQGNESVLHECGVYTRGLHSVLVLIGAYNLENGDPIIGVVNQPFSSKSESTNEWEGRSFWGLHQPGLSAHSSIPAAPAHVEASPKLVISVNESAGVCDRLRQIFALIAASGGGYKQMCVLEGLVSGFVLSKGSCFKWDTCAPHAILRSLGGGALDLRKALEVVRLGSDDLRQKLVSDCQLMYQTPDSDDFDPGQKWSNAGGLLAYIDLELAITILQTLKEIS